MKTFLVIALVAVSAATADEAPDRLEDQAVLHAFTRPAALPGGPLWLTVLNDRTALALWRGDPALSTLRIEVANSGTSLYVMGLATRDLQVPTEIAIVQGEARATGRVVNVANLNGRTAPEGSAIVGLLEFEPKVDTTRPFTVYLGDTSVQFAIEPALAARWGAVTMPGMQGF